MNPEAKLSLPLHAHDSLWLPSSFRFLFSPLNYKLCERDTVCLIHETIPRAIWVNPLTIAQSMSSRGCHWRHLCLFTCRWLISHWDQRDSVPFCRFFPSLPYTQLLHTWLGFTLGTLREDSDHTTEGFLGCLPWQSSPAWVPRIWLVYLGWNLRILRASHPIVTSD